MNLSDKEFKVVIINKLIKLRRMNEHGENFKKELENIKKNEAEFRNTVNEIKNTLEGINSRLDNIEEQVSDLEDRVVEIKLNRKKKKTFNGGSLRDLWDNIKCTNVHIRGLSEGEEREKEVDNLFGEKSS